MINTVPQPTLFENKPRARESIPLCEPEISGNEWDYVKECLDSGWVSSVGGFVNSFERSIADYIGADHCVATVSGTAALHVGLLVAGVEPNDEVIVPALTFVAPANAVRYAGAWPVFVDVDPDFWQIDVCKVTEFLRSKCEWRGKELRNRTTGRRIRALLPVDLLGHPVDLDPLLQLCEEYNLVIVEDATESLGAAYKGKKVGAAGRIGCFSFNGNKLITTGGGGMIATQDPALAKRARHLTEQAKGEPPEYFHNEIGFNYRLSNIHAAIGCAQMERVDQKVYAKRKMATAYDTRLRGIPGVKAMAQADWADSVFWLYTVLIDAQDYGMDSRHLMHKLASHGIQSRPLWTPLHQLPMYREVPQERIEVAVRLHKTALSLPSSVSLATQLDTIDYIADCIANLHEGGPNLV